MSTEELAAEYGGTRWRRFGLAFGTSFGAIATVMVLMATGVLALPVTISGTQFKVTATSLVSKPNPNGGSEFIQYGSFDWTKAGDPTTATAVAVTDLPGGGILTGMNQTVCGPTGLPGAFSHLVVELTASEANASGGLVVDATKLNADDATFDNIEIGVQGPGGTFAQTADHVVINNVDQTAVYTQAGQFKLTNLGLNAHFASSC